MTEARAPRDDDRVVSLGSAFTYSLGLGIAIVTIPLRALDAGYDAAAVGFLVATAAASQLTVRLALPWLLGRYPDRTLVGAGGLGLAIAFGSLVASTALPVFVVAQLLQGGSRSLFWTGSQTHAIRGPGRPIQRLVDLNVASNVGTLSGPALAGMLALAGLALPLTVAAAAALATAVGSRFLRPLPPYDRTRGAGTWRLLRRDGVDVACWASAVGGTWWSMTGSYIPVLGLRAGLGSVGIGWLITLSEFAGMVTLLALRRLPAERVRGAVRIAGFTATGALVGLAVAAAAGVIAVLPVFAVLMVAGGAGSGTTTTMSPGLASMAATPAEQGDALALSGTFRAAALLAAPAGVGLLLGSVGVPAAVAIAASLVGAPGLAIGRRPRNGPVAIGAAAPELER